MNAAKVDTAQLNIAPGHRPEFRAIAVRLRERGLWDSLCRHALWQIATPEGRPVHTEDSAFWTILDHVGEPEHGLGPEIDRLMEVLEPPCLIEALCLAGRRHLSMGSWAYWKRVLNLPPEPEDADAWRFADGWNLRRGTRPISSGERRPGEIPETFKGENITWGYDPDRGDVYPVPI